MYKISLVLGKEDCEMEVIQASFKNNTKFCDVLKIGD